VGYAQFDWSLRNNPRVELLERTNIVDVPTPERMGTIDLAVCDVSFTSVVSILPSVMELLKDGGAFLTLVKPQFEAARDEVDEGGIVHDPEVRLEALMKVAGAFVDAGLAIKGACESPITGAKGNHEYLLYGRRGEAGLVPDLSQVVREGETFIAS
jgi:23S rRNA (cytidine1920-2'-O)/16S rRNA (cytidine1409-2'-O)-methyltransferase